jgi:hypothetical protein
MKFVIFGGGCYGSFYARQLLRAAAAGEPVTDITIVDHNARPPARSVANSALLNFVREDWDSFCDGYFGGLSLTATDQIVPPPFTPHLPLRWLLRRLPVDRPDLTWETEPIRRMPGTPFQHQSPDGPLTLSHADWTCPVHCVEPERCPVTGGPRYWDVARTVENWTAGLAEGGQKIARIHLFQCLHYTHGVGTYPAAKVAAAHCDLAAAQPAEGEPARFLVGTVSHCHGAIHLLKAETGTDTVSSAASSSHSSLQ